MSTVKFDEGTKVETTLELEDGEGVIFVRPIKNRTMVLYSDGCIETISGKSRSGWANLVLTNKRIAVIHVPPNKKNKPVGSFYYKDITKVQMESERDAAEAAKQATFKIIIKPKCETVRFTISMAYNLKNIINQTRAQMAVDSAKAMPNIVAGLYAMDAPHYTARSLDKYYGAMEKAAKERAANFDFSTAGHAQIRDYLVDVVNQFVDIANS